MPSTWDLNGETPWWSDPNARREFLRDLPAPLRAFYAAHRIGRGSLRPGYALCVVTADARYLYVGPARHVGVRLADLRAGCPLPLRLVHVLPGMGAVTEAAHRDLWPAHLHHGWFRLDEHARRWLREVGCDDPLDAEPAPDPAPQPPPPGGIPWPDPDTLPVAEPGQICLSVAAVAGWLGIDEAGVWHLIRTEQIPAIRVGRGRAVVPVAPLRDLARRGEPLTG